MAKNSIRSWLSTLGALCLILTCCWAWGQDGHSIIAEIVARVLNCAYASAECLS